MEINSKKCGKCGITKQLTSEYFRTRKDHPLGYSSQCRDCIQEYDRQRSLIKRRRLGLKPIGERRVHEIEGHQRCTKCKSLHPSTQEFFSPDKRCSNGLHSYCRICERKRSNEYRKTRRKTPEGKKIIAEHTKRYRPSPKGINQKRISSSIHNHKRRQRFTNLPFDWSIRYWNECLNAFGNRCAYCEKEGPFHQDHYVPLSHPECTGTVRGNIVPACVNCNLSKGSLHPHIWIDNIETRHKVEKILKELLNA